MMQETVVTVSAGGIETITGWKNVVGNRYVNVGDLVWTDNNFALVGDQQSSNYVPYVPEDGYCILEALGTNILSKQLGGGDLSQVGIASLTSLANYDYFVYGTDAAYLIKSSVTYIQVLDPSNPTGSSNTATITINYRKISVDGIADNSFYFTVTKYFADAIGLNMCRLTVNDDGDLVGCVTATHVDSTTDPTFGTLRYTNIKLTVCDFTNSTFVVTNIDVLPTSNISAVLVTWDYYRKLPITNVVSPDVIGSLLSDDNATYKAIGYTGNIYNYTSVMGVHDDWYFQQGYTGQVPQDYLKSNDGNTVITLPIKYAYNASDAQGKNFPISPPSVLNIGKKYSVFNNSAKYHRDDTKASYIERYILNADMSIKQSNNVSVQNIDCKIIKKSQAKKILTYMS